MLTFEQFKENGIACAVVRSLGPVAGADDKATWLDVLEDSVSFDDFRRKVTARSGALSGTRHFVDSVNATFGALALSDGKFNLLCALCSMLDFGHLADELVKKRKSDYGEGVWAGLYASMDPQHAKVMATMIYQASIA